MSTLLVSGGYTPTINMAKQEHRLFLMIPCKHSFQARQIETGKVAVRSWVFSLEEILTTNKIENNGKAIPLAITEIPSANDQKRNLLIYSTM